MKLGLYGGSFDPIHYGHLRPVRRARETLKLDQILYLPTSRPPHKGRELTPAWMRYAMVELALLREERMYASALEMRGTEASYTIDTIEHFRRAHPGAGLFLIVGSDSFAGLTSWRRWQEILTQAELAVLARPGWELEAGPGELAPQLRDALDRGRVHLISDVTIDVSSTEVRRRIGEEATARRAANRKPRELTERVPRLVLEYIRKYELYRENPGNPSAT